MGLRSLCEGGAGLAHIAAPHTQIATALRIDASVFLKTIVGVSFAVALPAIAIVMALKLGKHTVSAKTVELGRL